MSEKKEVDETLKNIIVKAEGDEKTETKTETTEAKTTETKTGEAEETETKTETKPNVDEGKINDVEGTDANENPGDGNELGGENPGDEDESDEDEDQSGGDEDESDEDEDEGDDEDMNPKNIAKIILDNINEFVSFGVKVDIKKLKHKNSEKITKYLKKTFKKEIEITGIKSPFYSEILKKISQL